MEEKLTMLKALGHGRYDPMVYWVDSLGKLSDIPFIDNHDVFFL